MSALLRSVCIVSQFTSETRHLMGPCTFALLLLSVVVLSGCSTSREDQAFYENGWLWPRGMDTPDRPVTPREKAEAAAAAADARGDW
jgi:hypothetical protein